MPGLEMCSTYFSTARQHGARTMKTRIQQKLERKNQIPTHSQQASLLRTRRKLAAGANLLKGNKLLCKGVRANTSDFLPMSHQQC